MLTYGDGLSNVNLDSLLSHHKSSKCKMTVTAVRPLARFGELIIESGKVTSFKEKPQLATGYINGGYFICEPSVFDYLDDDSTVLEGYPLETIASESNLSCFIHNGFWQCMDTKRDRDYLEEFWNSGKAPWKK
jgi:glucose-1-phosphate cytidylyltransferase